jgi:hypothetical protein
VLPVTIHPVISRIILSVVTKGFCTGAQAGGTWLLPITSRIITCATLYDAWQPESESTGYLRRFFRGEPRPLANFNTNAACIHSLHASLEGGYCKHARSAVMFRSQVMLNTPHTYHTRMNGTASNDGARRLGSIEAYARRATGGISDHGPWLMRSGSDAGTTRGLNLHKTLNRRAAQSVARSREFCRSHECGHRSAQQKHILGVDHVYESMS